MAVILPRLPEADVACIDTRPGDNGGEARDGEHPIERFSTGVGAGSNDETQQADKTGKADSDQGPTRLINVSEDLRRLATICESGDGARGAVDGRVANGQYSDENYGVHDAGYGGDLGVLDRNDEWGGISVRGGATVEELGVVVWNDTADNGE